MADPPPDDLTPLTKYSTAASMTNMYAPQKGWEQFSMADFIPPYRDLPHPGLDKAPIAHIYSPQMACDELSLADLERPGLEKGQSSIESSMSPVHYQAGPYLPDLTYGGLHCTETSMSSMHYEAETSLHLPGLTHGVGSMKGSYQQLLRDANTGVLFPGIAVPHSVVPNDHEDDTVIPCEEGYFGGTESEKETTAWNSGCDTDEDMSAGEEEGRNQYNDYGAIDEYVASFSDDIASNEFVLTVDDDNIRDGFCVDGDITEIDDDLGEKDHCNSDVDANLQDGCDQNVPSCDLGDCGCVTIELSQEICPKYLEGETLGYKKRQRAKKGAVRRNCRTPRDMGAIEIAMRTSAHRRNEHIFEPVVGMVFDSREEAREFYNMYSWEVGFGIIFNRRRMNDEKTYRSMQEICCHQGGSDRRVQIGTKKVRCKARIKLLRTEDDGWYISEFMKEHNHELAESYAEKRECGSHKQLDEHTLNMIRYLRDNDVSQTQVRCIISRMFGSLGDAPCTKRSIRTICNQLKREQMDNDVNKTIEIFKEMHEKDPGFQWSVELGENELGEKDTIKTLMWCSGKSRAQYACFGDVITFDTTYCTNFYKMPFGLFVGVNNHFQSIIYAGVLMKYETTESFEWVFKEFLKLMGGKPPKTVLTDMCKSMTIALGEVWPGTYHIWCKWHVMKGIRHGLGRLFTRDATFREKFFAIVNDMLTKEEFQLAWVGLCDEYKLTDNPFMIRTYQCREKWAKAWCQGNYCAGMTSTQRSESANMMLKRFVPRNSSMHHFVSQFELLLQDREMEEGRQEYQTKQLEMKYKHMWPIERHALKIYTKATFMLFRKQINRASHYIVSGKGQNFYVISHNNADNKPTWAKSHFKVYVEGEGTRYSCECGQYEHLGILCCHILRLMIRLDIAEIPEAHIMMRWTRSAKEILPDHLKFLSKGVGPKKTLTHSTTMLNQNALLAVSKGNTDMETCQVVMKHLSAALKEVDAMLLARTKKAVGGSSSDDAGGAHQGRVPNQSDTEGLAANMYGAAGSSAGMSDTEILNIKAPLVNRARGRPRVNRFRSKSESSGKNGSKAIHKVKEGAISKAKVKGKQSLNSSTNKKVKSKITEGFGSSKDKPGLPRQSIFCSACKTTGHNKTRCNGKGNPPKPKKGKAKKNQSENQSATRCSRCDLTGHTEEECLVLEDDEDTYYLEE